MSNFLGIFRGNNKTVQFVSKKKDTDGTYSDYTFTGCTAKLYVKRKVSDTNANAVITLTGTLVDSETFEFYFVPSTTDDATVLVNEKVYPFDIEITTGAGKTYTALRGSFVIFQP